MTLEEFRNLLLAKRSYQDPDPTAVQLENNVPPEEQRKAWLVHNVFVTFCLLCCRAWHVLPCQDLMLQILF